MTCEERTSRRVFIVGRNPEEVAALGEKIKIRCDLTPVPACSIVEARGIIRRDTLPFGLAIIDQILPENSGETTVVLLGGLAVIGELRVCEINAEPGGKQLTPIIFRACNDSESLRHFVTLIGGDLTEYVSKDGPCEGIVACYKELLRRARGK